MPPLISNNLKAHIPALRHEQCLSVKKICHILNIKKTLAYQTLHYHCQHGVTHDVNAQQPGHHCTLTSMDLSFICKLLNQQHTIYLNEILEQLLLCCCVKVSLTTLTHTLWQLLFTHKDISGKALECNECLHAIYMNHIADLVIRKLGRHWYDQTVMTRTNLVDTMWYFLIYNYHQLKLC